MSGTIGLRHARISILLVRSSMCLVLVALSLWRLEVAPAGVIAGPNDPPDATVAPGGPNDPNDPDGNGDPNDPNDPGDVEPTPTFQSEEPIVTPTSQVPDEQDPDDGTEEPVPPDNPLPAPPPIEPTSVEIAPDVHLPDVSLPTVPAIPKLMPATLRLAGRICDRDGFDPYLNTMGTDWRAHCTEAAPFSFGVTVMRSAPATSYSLPLSVAAGGVGGLTIPAPSTLEIQHLADGFNSPVVFCSSTVAGSWTQGAFPLVTIDAAPGDVIDCIWYAVRQDDDVTIEGYVHVCGPEVASTGTTTPQEMLEDLCTGSLDAGVRIDLTNADGTITRNWVMEGAMGTPVADTYWSRSASVFLDLPPGTYTLTMNVPAGYSYAFVSRCGPISGYGGYFEALPPVSGSPSSYAVNASTAGKTYLCDWYLVPSA